MEQEPRAALRAAVRRLMAALRQPTVEVTVERRDIEVLLGVALEARNARAVAPAPPQLHPAQQ